MIDQVEFNLRAGGRLAKPVVQVSRKPNPLRLATCAPDETYRTESNLSLLQDPLAMIFFAVALITALTVHEFSHAYVANYLGDDTARLQGRISLNPLRHLDPAGTLMIVIASITGIGIGWGKPVPVNPYRLRMDPRAGMAVVAAAGPISNIIQAAIGSVLLRSGIFSSSVISNLIVILIVVNVSLAVFNMLPISPLDGFRVLVGILPSEMANLLAKLAPFGPGLLILLVFVLPQLLRAYFGWLAAPLIEFLLRF